MFTRLLSLFTILGLLIYSSSYADTISNLPHCQLDNNGYYYWNNCFGSQTFDYFPKGGSNGVRYGYQNQRIKGNANIYTGEWKSNKPNGYGEIIFADGSSYKGQWINGFFHGNGYFIHSLGSEERGVFVNGRLHEGVRKLSNGLEADFKNGQPISSYEPSKGNQNLSKAQNNIPTTTDNQRLESDLTKSQLEQDRQLLAEERRRLDADKEQRERERKTSRIFITASATQPDDNGDFSISIQTAADTASLKIDGDEQGGKRDGNYVIRRVARVGEQNVYTITARDVYGNTDSKTISVVRQVADSAPTVPKLNPANVQVKQSRDAVAIIVGIENYKRVAKADFANADAKDFYTYANRALGIKPENIKLLVDEGAGDIEILSAFQNWLPLKVNKGKTDVYVFYSGHGFPSQDGKGLYFLPFNVDKQYLDRTSVKQRELIAALQTAQAKSVTLFIDACYSGQTRNGETLVAGIKPLAPKIDEQAYPPDFTVITASAFDQLSSASADLKHGIFSFYLMKGMEGDADENKDGRITAGELQRYLSDRVGRQAMGMNRTQNTQLFGDADRVLVGR